MVIIESLRVEFNGMDFSKYGDEGLLSEARHLDNLFRSWEEGYDSYLLMDKIETAFARVKADYDFYSSRCPI